jgi:vancomycin resistance protein VanJ
MFKIILRSLMWGYLILLLAIWACVHFVTGDSWWVTLFLFSPRWVLGLPWLVLFPLTALVEFRTALWYVLHLWILAIPLLGACLPALTSLGHSPPAGAQSVRILTCNVGGGTIRVPQLVALLKQERTEIMLLQECNAQLYAELQAALDWNFRNEGKLVIASLHRLSAVSSLTRQTIDNYQVSVAISVDVSRDSVLGEGEPPADFLTNVDSSASSPVLRVVCLHFPTFRPAFEKARSMDASADGEFETLAKTYRDLADDAVQRLKAVQTPTIIGGDFNVPSESSFYRDYWTGYQNALTLKGWGLCYTKYTRLHGVRIDHLLADANWTVNAAHVGPDLGGDHRPVSVVLSRDKTSSQL